MYYYEVWVGAINYHGVGTLTYQSSEKLANNQVVLVPMQDKIVPGWISTSVKKPSFKSKDIQMIISTESLPIALVQLQTWLRNYYPAPSGQINSLIVPPYLKSEYVSTLPSAPAVVSKAPPFMLSAEQKAAIKQIQEQPSGSFLLHGDTGSGKTAVYARLASLGAKAGKSSIILTPEIGLTSQLVSNLRLLSGLPVRLLHSGLTIKQRSELWHQIINFTGPQVIVGPRSALFAPLHNVGLIVLDEFHDTAYKQEQPPHYQTSRVAAQLAKLHGGWLVLGSATPPVQDYYTFTNKGLPIIRMQRLAVTSDHAAPIIKVISLRDKGEFTQSEWLSNSLIEAIQLALKNKEQSLVFINRRGSARLTLCKECGWQALCMNCDIPLTYHADGHNLICHTCGYQQGAPSSCPVCQSTDIIFQGAGTKAITTELQKLFPSARVQRFDGDNKKSESFQKSYQSVRDGEVDIIVGTQMLAKGLDLPKLSVVGVVLADTTLYFPDFSSEERTYQTINQVLGRVGRGHRNSTAIIQSYNTENPNLGYAVGKDYASFYLEQIQQRQNFGFPPFYFLLKLTCSKKNLAAIKRSASKLISSLKDHDIPCTLMGPSPAFIEKSHGKLNWQLIFKSRSRKTLLQIIPLVPSDWNYDIDPVDLI